MQLKGTSLLKILMVMLASFSAGAVFSQDPALGIIVNSVGIQLVLIPAGSFRMGSAYEEKNRQEDEEPHSVTISRSFYISRTEITQRQWRSLQGLDKSFFKGDDLPVEKISWYEAVTFCQKLSQQEGKKYRLPTEAEWEYACRGRWGNGADAGSLGDHAWYRENSEETTHVVAQKKPNSMGLNDMLGNVAEWCQDVYAAEYPASPVQDPQGPEQGTFRLMRGGSWASLAPACRCASRSDAPAAYQLKQTGFRIVLEY